MYADLRFERTTCTVLHTNAFLFLALFPNLGDIDEDEEFESNRCALLSLSFFIPNTFFRVEIVESDDFKWNDYAAADFVSKSDLIAPKASSDATPAASAAKK